MDLQNIYKSNLRWVLWSVLSAALLVSDIFFYIRKVETAMVDPEIFLVLLCTHLYFCFWAYKNIVRDKEAGSKIIGRKILLFGTVVAVFFASVFEIINRNEHFAAIAIFLFVVLVLRIREKRRRD